MTSLLASSMRPEAMHGAGSVTAVLVVVAVAALAGGCLYLLFRRGSIADRARRDESDSDEPAAGQRR